MYIENIDLFYQSLSKSRPYHIDNCYEFHYIAQGKGVFDVAGKSNIIKEGDFFFTLPPEKHRLIFKTVNENIMQYLIRIHLDKNDADLKTYIETILLKQRFFHIGTHHKYFFENFKQLFKSNILLNQKSALYQFIGFLYTLGNIKTSFKNPKYILYLEQALKSMYESVDQNLNMREISDKLGINLCFSGGKVKKKSPSLIIFDLPATSNTPLPWAI